MPQSEPKEKTPGTDTEDRDEAVRLLQDIFARMMRQPSVDSLDPGFRDEIASVVDSIISAAKPGNQSQTVFGQIQPAGATTQTLWGNIKPVTFPVTPVDPAKPETLSELVRDIVGDVEAIPGAIQKTLSEHDPRRKRKPQ